MKKLFLTASLGFALSMTFSCNDNAKKEPDSHTHDDGSTHADHDTIKPNQENFTVADSTQKDSSHKEHTHSEGEKHSH